VCSVVTKNEPDGPIHPIYIHPPPFHVFLTYQNWFLVGANDPKRQTKMKKQKGKEK
jgi:hypothetical protein